MKLRTRVFELGNGKHRSLSELAQESVEVQRAVIGILSILKSVAKGISKEGS